MSSYVSSNQVKDIGSKYNMSSFKALHIDLHTNIQQRKVKFVEQTHACTYECMTYLIYLVANQQLWHSCMDM